MEVFKLDNVVFLVDYWVKDGYARLLYSNDLVLKVPEVDFNRAYGPIISASFEDVLRDFAVENY